MLEAQLDRRQMFGAGAGLLAFTALPAQAKRARPGKLGWPGVQALFDGYVADDRLPGAVGAIARGAEDASFIVSGKIARNETRVMDADSLFRIYSMTKPITGMAAMMLIEDGKLGLDQDVGDFIPGFKSPRVAIDPKKSLESRPASGPLTIRHLMTHSGGLGYIIAVEGALLAEYARLGLVGGLLSRKPLPGFPNIIPAPSLAEFADRIATLPLVHEPGTRWAYSAGLDVLGRIIEIVSGMPFDLFLKTRIFDPLGMSSTFFQVPASEAARLTTNYGVSPLGKFPIDPGKDSIYLDKPAMPLGGGGLVSSARDYDRFLRMLAGYGAIGRTRIMKTSTAKLGMSNLLPPGTDTKGTFADSQGFGAGGRVTIAPDARGSGIGTFGWGGAAATIAWVDPTRSVRASGFAQYMPDQSMPFTTDFGKAVYAGL